MKKSVIAFCGLALTFSACSMGDVGPIGGDDKPVVASMFTVKIDGQESSAISTSCTNYFFDKTLWEIEGGSSSFDISLFIKGKEVGTYMFDPETPKGNRFIYRQTYYNVYTSHEGQVTITESNDKYIRGIFAFKTKDTTTNTVNHTFTEGKFTSYFRN